MAFSGTGGRTLTAGPVPVPGAAPPAAAQASSGTTM